MERVRWSGDPAHLDAAWRALSARDDGAHKLWTDDYLAAFAQVEGVPLATTDRQFEVRYPAIEVVNVP